MEESIIKQLLERLSWSQIVLILILFGFFLYISNLTTPVPNLINSTNDTFKVLYSPTDLVPPTFIPFEYSLIGSVLVAVLVLTFLLSQQRDKKRIGEREAKELVVSEFKKKEDIALAGGNTFETKNYHIKKILSCITPKYRVGAERKPKYIAIGLELEDKETRLSDIYIVRVDPYERLIDDILPSTRELVGSDKCSNCGKEFDEKPVTSEDLLRMKHAEKAIKT